MPLFLVRQRIKEYNKQEFDWGLLDKSERNEKSAGRQKMMSDLLSINWKCEWVVDSSEWGFGIEK